MKMDSHSMCIKEEKTSESNDMQLFVDMQFA